MSGIAQTCRGWAPPFLCWLLYNPYLQSRLVTALVAASFVHRAGHFFVGLNGQARLPARAKHLVAERGASCQRHHDGRCDECAPGRRRAACDGLSA